MFLPIDTTLLVIKRSRNSTSTIFSQWDALLVSDIASSASLIWSHEFEVYDMLVRTRVSRVLPRLSSTGCPPSLDGHPFKIRALKMRCSSHHSHYFRCICTYFPSTRLLTRRVPPSEPPTHDDEYLRPSMMQTVNSEMFKDPRRRRLGLLPKQ